MNILLKTLGDPIWQVLALVITLAAPVLIVAVRTGSVHAWEREMRPNTLIILRVWLATFLLMSGVAVTQHLLDATPQTTSRTVPIPALTPSTTRAPTSTPTSIPTSPPTPRLARSMTQGLTTVCGAITNQDYQTAWKQYACSLQDTHPEPETFAAWRMFVRCTTPEQSGIRQSRLDLHSMAVTGVQTVGETPDVPALGSGWHLLYVASETGVLSVFEESGQGLRKLYEGFVATEVHPSPVTSKRIGSPFLCRRCMGGTF